MKLYRVKYITGFNNVTSLWYEEFTVIKETHCGYWYAYGNPSETWINQVLKSKDPIKNFCRWVSKTSKKRYCYPTKEEAVKSFIIRSELYIGFLEQRIKERKQALLKAKAGDLSTLPSLKGTVFGSVF